MREFSNFVECLKKATGNIEQKFFYFPIDGLKSPIFRERVYCYELYHQLRLIWNKDSQFSINGEVDKAGHPLMISPYLSNAKPDFLVHIPGNMEGNFVVIEVKPISAKKNGIKKDLKTLSAFLDYGNYKYAIFLIYGNSRVLLEKFFRKANEIKKEENIPLQRIFLLWHENPGMPAKKVEWMIEQ